MRERLNRTDSKSVELLVSSVGSNPTLSARSGSKVSDNLGEMTERPKVHAWKACVLYPGTEGSNPSLSVVPLALIIRPYAVVRCPTPSGPEGSSGKYQGQEMYVSLIGAKGFLIRGTWHTK